MTSLHDQQCIMDERDDGGGTDNAIIEIPVFNR